MTFKLYDRVKFSHEAKDGVVVTWRGEFRGQFLADERAGGHECAVVYLDEGFYNEAQTMFIRYVLVALENLEAEPEDEIPLREREFRSSRRNVP
jgi:hypothetical protein